VCVCVGNNDDDETGEDEFSVSQVSPVITIVKRGAWSIYVAIGPMMSFLIDFNSSDVIDNLMG